MEFLYHAAPSIKINCVTLTQDWTQGSAWEIGVCGLFKQRISSNDIEITSDKWRWDQERLPFARFRRKMTSLSNDYQRWLYYRSFPRATAWPFHTSYLDTYCWKNLRASDIVGANTSDELPRVWSNTKGIILYYYCTDETSEPELTPECAQCARHTKDSLYFQHVYLWANSQTDDAKTGAFPLPRWVHVPCLRPCSLWFHFLRLLCAFSSVQAPCSWSSGGVLIT